MAAMLTMLTVVIIVAIVLGCLLVDPMFKDFLVFIK
jgi:hypothetical protein